MKRYITLVIIAVSLFVPSVVLAAPSSVDRITDRIEPLIKTDFIRAVYFNATSTTATSTFAGKLKLGSFSALPQIIGPDEDTGFHFDGPDVLSFHTGGQTRMTINSLGNVGIATSAPYARFSVVGDVAASNFAATSTNATSTFQGNVVLSPDGQNPFGFAVSPLVVEGPLAGPYQMIIANTLSSSVSLAGITIGNNKFRNPGFTADYYCGFYMASDSYNLAGFNGILPNGGAVFCKDGPITIGSATSTAGPEIRFQATGMDSGNVDAVIEGSTGNFGIGTTSPYAKLSIHPLATDTQRTLFAIASSTATATSTHMVVLNNGSVGLATTSPSGRFAVTYDPSLTTERREFFILNGVGLVNRYDNSAIDNMRLQNFSAQASTSMGTAIRFDLSAQSGGVVTQIHAGTIAVVRSQDWTSTVSSQNSAITFSTRNGTGGVGERMRIGPSGLVGINTSPLGRLDVAGTSASTLTSFDGERMISVINTSTTTNNAQGIAFRSRSLNGTTVSGAELLAVNTARTTFGLTSDLAILTTTDSTKTEKMRVTSVGMVGIGTTTPYAQLSASTTNSTFPAAAFYNQSTGPILYGATTGSDFGTLYSSGNQTPTLTLQGSDRSVTLRTNSNILEVLGSYQIAKNSSATTNSGLLFVNNAASTNYGNIGIESGNSNMVFTNSVSNGHFVFSGTGTSNFGIGTTTPSTLFSVGQSGSATSSIFLDSTSGKGGCIVVKDAGGTGYTYITTKDGVLTASTVPCN